MSAAQIVALLLAIVLLGFGALAYRRGGTQGGVILIFVALLCALYGLGLIESPAAPAEAEQS